MLWSATESSGRRNTARNNSHTARANQSTIENTQPHAQAAKVNRASRLEVTGITTTRDLLSTYTSITPLCLAAATRSRGPRRGRWSHLCPAERRRRRLLGRQLLRGAGDGRHDGQADTDGGDGAWGRCEMFPFSVTYLVRNPSNLEQVTFATEEKMHLYSVFCTVSCYADEN